MLRAMLQAIAEHKCRAKCDIRDLVGLDEQMRDVRPAWLSVAICRVAIFGALYLLFDSTWSQLGGDAQFSEWFATKISGAYYPFGILKLFGSTLPPVEFWWMVRWIAQIATGCAIVGLWTRPMMIASVISNNLLALLLISDSYFWSHSWNVVFLAAIPFALCKAGTAFSLDRLIARRWPAYPAGQRDEPVLWGVLAAQAGVAMFLFAAFWAKIFQAVAKAGWLGPWYYVFSDNMRNILGVFWLGVPENLPPPWIEWAWSTPIIWKLLILGHLAMQAVPLLAVVSLHRPFARLIEGGIFVAGIIALGFIARGWNWAWLPLAATFVDWDFFFRRRADLFRPSAPPSLMIMVASALTAFFGVFTIGWVTQKANSWGLYPFSNMNFYASLYVAPPYDQHRPYADYLIGEVTLRPPPNSDPRSFLTDRPDVTGKSWRDLDADPPAAAFRVRDGEITFPFLGNEVHGLGREPNLERLKGGLSHARYRIGLYNFTGGGRYVAWLTTAGFPAYPEPMRKKLLHAGVRGIWDAKTNEFVGLTATFDWNADRLKIEDIRGETGRPSDRKVFARFNAHLTNEMQPLTPVPGKWIDDRTFQVEPGFLDHYRRKLLNSIVRTETIFGTVDFDGPMQWL